MKKLRSIILLVVVAFILTGCMRFNAQMDIKKDKSMDFSIVYALDTSAFGDEAEIKDSDIKEMEKGGFSVERYTDGTYKGVKLTKNVKNIDDVSTEKDAEFDLSGVTSGNSGKKYLFKVKKGFLKNVYTAKYKFDTSKANTSNFSSSTLADDDLDSDDNLSTDDDDWNTDDSTYDDSSYDSSDDDIDYSQMMSSMDLSFNVKLPYKALSHNSNNSTNNDKELKWDLTKMNNEDIEFSFELYNTTAIIILIAGGCVLLAVIVVVIILIINSKKKKQSNTPQPTATVQAAEPAPAAPAAPAAPIVEPTPAVEPVTPAPAPVETAAEPTAPVVEPAPVTTPEQQNNVQ